MRALAAVEPIYRWRPFSPNAEEKEKGSNLLKLWHQAKQLILSEKYVHYYYTHGLNYLHGKPKRDWIRNYSIRKERPQLVTKRIDKGEYYQFELRFRVNRKLHIPDKSDFGFFINGTTDPQNLYLLDRFSDFQLVSFFAPFGYKLAMLKYHYRDDLRDFVEKLTAEYKTIEV